MEHLVIGAAPAAHIHEYARSWELATSARPRMVSWIELCAATIRIADPRPGPLLVRLGLPTSEEVAALTLLGGAPQGSADVESAPCGLLGMERAVGRLGEALGAQGVVVHHINPLASHLLLLDREKRQRILARDGIPIPAPWRVPEGGAHERYESFREWLRHRPGTRAVVRLSRALLPPPPSPGSIPPTVLVWLGGRGIRAQANCRFGPQGAVRDEVHPIEDEAELRPLLGRLFEAGATVEDDWPCAEISSRPFTLSLLVVGRRVVLGEVCAGGVWRLRGAAPESGVPRDLQVVRRQVNPEVYEQIEQTCVRLCQVHRCAGLVVDVALSRRFDRFAVLEVDPFADMPPGVRDSVGWSGSDHLVRSVRQLLTEDAGQKESSGPP